MSGVPEDVQNDLARSEAVWLKLVQYAAAANGTALVLGVTAAAKILNPASTTSVGKLPLVIFALGLLFAGIHLASSMAYYFERSRVKARNEIDRMAKEVEEIRSDTLTTGVIDGRSMDLREKVEAMRSTMDTLDKTIKPGQLGDLRHFQEISIWISYILFFVGVSIALYRL